MYLYPSILYERDKYHIKNKNSNITVAYFPISYQ